MPSRPAHLRADSSRPSRSRQTRVKRQAQPDEKQVYEDQVVVTASKREQTLVNAPATVSLITSETLQNSGSTSYADLSSAPCPA